MLFMNFSGGKQMLFSFSLTAGSEINKKKSKRKHKCIYNYWVEHENHPSISISFNFHKFSFENKQSSLKS